MKPILFNTEMVRAIRNDTKTVTRRAVKPQPEEKPIPIPYEKYWIGCFAGDDVCRLINPPYIPSDILYVRETWARIDENFDPIWFENPALLRNGQIIYRAEHPEFSECRWRPSIHMPREAARIFLRVTDVRVERLQDITDDGIARDFNFCAEALEIMNAQQKDVACIALWDSTINPTDRARYGWEANPWVWVIEFERCEKPKDAE